MYVYMIARGRIVYTVRYCIEVCAKCFFQGKMLCPSSLETMCLPACHSSVCEGIHSIVLAGFCICHQCSQHSWLIYTIVLVVPVQCHE